MASAKTETAVAAVPNQKDAVLEVLNNGPATLAQIAAGVATATGKAPKTGSLYTVLNTLRRKGIQIVKSAERPATFSLKGNKGRKRVTKKSAKV